MLRILLLIASVFAAPLAAAPVLEPQQITPDAWAIVGPTTQRDPQNLGNNSTHGLIVTPDGAVLIDAGGSYAGAAALHAVIQDLTDQPVRFVINTGGQDHRWLGNGYWQEHGAQIIASADAVADQTTRASMQLTALSVLIGAEALAGTSPTYADIRFDTDYELTLGGTTLYLSHLHGAHTPGDAFVWHPAAATMFTGDIVYVGRILGVMEFSNSAHWLDTFDAMAALNPAHIVPGHGPVTDLATATHDTRDYLANLRQQIAAYIEEGGDIFGAVDVDQSAFASLENFDTLARRNAQEVFSQMEWE
ncbi:MBL fold metallo-hydrolase [Thalassovita taeanensis]|uniref:Glyoxylase, beta-lactamase superfamily II n=1 Tax=Thalassovita taeanensis TaxID=657014 RepID=A0A1H9CLR2_9RHOB|nr:MBL fold metallo-hydrolase [Thalassovita taeanensis]SEQ02145.1 Glyoxylase, beta-lactamase superfamily II [Thalassovita taeanensis]